MQEYYSLLSLITISTIISVVVGQLRPAVADLAFAVKVCRATFEVLSLEVYKLCYKDFLKQRQRVQPVLMSCDTWKELAQCRYRSCEVLLMKEHRVAASGVYETLEF